MAVRIFAILARKARRAVVFRRGPSKQVLLLSWRTDTDVFEPGQWLKGHIYERRADLSPSGVRLIYFAANWKDPFQSWTAISKPPWLTAVALWKKGDAWGGGGLFADEDRVLLNHWLTPGGEGVRPTVGGLPPRVKVSALGERWGRGEDFPVWGLRLERDGWTLLQRGREAAQTSAAKDVRYPYDPPFVWSRPSPRTSKLELRMIVHGLHEKDGPWYAVEHALVDRAGRSRSLGEPSTSRATPISDWADWDVNGDLLIAWGGRIHRAKSPRALTHVEFEQIADLRAMKFEARESPPEAKKW